LYATVGANARTNRDGRIGEELKTALTKMGTEIPLYHSRLGTAWQRQELMKRFVGDSKPHIDQIICTNAFGMGLDIPDVRLVIHWQQPASIEDLLQEFGRAGRDGKASASVIFHDGHGLSRDTDRLKFMAQKTVEAAALQTGERKEMLEQRFRQIK
jgi:ATP-dependent DNA helicase RecQ